MTDANAPDDDRQQRASPYRVDPRERSRSSDESESDAELEPKPAQQDIINADAYPMRVLAGAGTGKTFTMVRKIERLLPDVPPGEILALTFTNKAADSMREKLAERLDARAYDIDAFTYHSIAYDLLTDHAYEADLDPEFEIAAEPEQYAIIYRILDDFDYRFISPAAYPLANSAEGIESELFKFITECKQKGIMPDEIGGDAGYLPPAETLLKIRDHVEEIRTVAETQFGGLTRKRSIKEEYFQTLVDGLATIESTLRDIEDAVREFGTRDTSQAPGTSAEADIIQYLQSLRRFAASYREMLTANRERLVGSALVGVQKYPLYVFGVLGSDNALPDGLHATRGPDELERFVETCMRARDLHAGYKEYEKRLNAHNLLDLQDLILEATDLVAADDTDVAVDTSWEYVFCDEFQDTDPIQFDLVRHLVGDGNLFVVGDDDQAVYEWRGANVDNIRTGLTDAFGPAQRATIADLRADAREEGDDDAAIERTSERLGEQHTGITDLPLEQNFRSVQPILDLANNAIAELADRESQKSLRAVDDAAEASEGVFFVRVEEDAEDAAERTRIVNTVRRLAMGEAELEEMPEQLGDIAVLVRTNEAAQSLATRFDSAGIPYEVAGGMVAHSTGVDTVVAMLNVLASPDDDVSLNRVLRMRYRLPESDLATLNTTEYSTLHALLLATEDDGYADWEAVAEAQRHFKELLRRRDADSLAQLYRRVKSVTDIERFLSERQREDLDYLDDVIESFGQSSIQPELDTGFIEYLRTHAATIRDSGGVNSQPDVADDAVNILTVHKSKGLEFQTVLLPHLDEWPSGERVGRTAQLLKSLRSPGSLPTKDGQVQRARAEQRRTLHVAITRAEENLLLFGQGQPNVEDPDEQGSDRADAWEFIEAGTPAADASEITFARPDQEFNPWETVHRCAPASARTVTESLAAELSADDQIDLETAQTDPSAVADDVDLLSAETIETDWQAPFYAAADRILSMGERMLANALDPINLEEYSVSSDATTDRTPADDLRRHSHTSLKLHAKCPRQHYLKYGVDAPTLTGTRQSGDDGESERTADTSVSRRIVGAVFHETADELTQRCLDAQPGVATSSSWPLERAEWYDVARRRSRRADAPTDALLAEVTDCIDELFRTDIVSWTPVASEHSFEKAIDIDVGGEERTYTLHGYIDGVFKREDGSLVVVDYKTGSQPKERERLQLEIYALAAAEGFQRRIDAIGFVYLNSDVMGRFEPRPRSEWSLGKFRRDLRTPIVQAATTSYDPAEPGAHCTACEYAWLPCYAPDGG